MIDKIDDKQTNLISSLLKAIYECLKTALSFSLILRLRWSASITFEML